MDGRNGHPVQEPPLSGARPGEAHRWGLQIQREIQSKNESVVWAPMSRDVLGYLGQMGVLEGMSESVDEPQPRAPADSHRHSGALNRRPARPTDRSPKTAAINLKYGITSNLTFDFTYNPDFSQIESDRQQIEVNQRFPVLYPELRPFFLEGQEIFRVPGPVTFIHTRTIVDPQYGAKLSRQGRQDHTGVSRRQRRGPGSRAEIPSSANRAIRRRPRAIRSVPRVHVGVIITDREFMNQLSRVGGLDGQFRVSRSQRVGFRLFSSQHRDAVGVETTGRLIDTAFRKEGRGLSYSVAYYEISPNFKTDSGFVLRTDERQVFTNVNYRWWPENWITNWGPRVNYNRNHQFSGVLQDQGILAGWNAQFARNINVNVNTERDMERYNGVDFHKVRYGIGIGVNTSRKFSVGGFTNFGDQIRYVENPYLGRGTNANVFTTIRPFSRLQTELTLTRSNFVDTRVQAEEFDIRIYRAQTTYQFTNRLLLRNILDYNDYDRTMGGNLLVTYRVNSGTAFYVGYDDRYQQADVYNPEVFAATDYTRINRAFFAKLQVLFRY